MTHVRLVAAQLIMPAALGPITQRRVEAVVGALREKALAVAQEGPPSGSVVVVAGSGLYVELTPVSVTAGFQGGQDVSLERAVGAINDVMAATVAESTGGPVARFVAHLAVEAHGVDVLNAYMTPGVRRLPGKLADAMWGIGFRYFLRTPTGRGECRVEPLVTDPSWVYVEYVLGSSDILPIAALGRFASERQAEFEALVRHLSEELSSAAGEGVDRQ